MTPQAKILIVGPAWVGDMVMAQSLFAALKQRHLDAELDVIAPAWSHALLNRMPEVNQAIALNVEHGAFNFKARYSLAKTLREHHYTQAIVLPNSWKSALIPLLARIPLRTGWRGEYRYGLLNDCRRLDKHTLPMMVDRFVALAYPKFTPRNTFYRVNPSLTTQGSDQKAALNKFSLSQHQPILALCPGAEFGPSKRWPENYYARVATQKLKEGWNVWLFGSKKDQVVSEKIQHLTQHRCQDLTGRTTLGEAIDLLSLATHVVTNDSGLMHIAAAVNVPTLALYGSTDPSFTPPLHKAAEIIRLGLPCSPCFKRVCPLKHHRCMQDMGPDYVLSKLSKLTATTQV